MSTRENAHGTVTANTNTQLSTKTWATTTKWHKLSVIRPWFTMNSERFYYTERKEDWFVSAQTCRAENSEAFAGQHQADSTSFYLFDEASAIEPIIYDVAQGGMTDGEPMMFIFGNATRNTGKFYDACFGRDRHRWLQFIVDSRTSRFTNKEQIEEWKSDYGEDSDFFRVRVLGLPPRQADLQFIDQQRVYDAGEQKTTFAALAARMQRVFGAA